MPETFGDAERHICALFSVGSQFIFRGTEYTVENVGKPTCGRGEPKTDIYVYASSSKGSREFKISFKKENADFLENKTNPERAEQLLGSNWEAIIRNATTALCHQFVNRPLIYKEKYRRTEAGAITLGWKFELLNVDNGQLSGNMHLTRSQVIDVYAGTNLGTDKRNAYVNGRMVPNSGVANFILFEEQRPSSVQEAADLLLSVEDYVTRNPNVYFACKALNYRTYHKKYDGNRPLAVYVDWSVRNGKLHHEIKFDRPLTVGGDYAASRLLDALKRINAETTDDLNGMNIEEPSVILGSSHTASATQNKNVITHTRPNTSEHNRPTTTLRNTTPHTTPVYQGCSVVCSRQDADHDKNTLNLTGVKEGSIVYHDKFGKGVISQFLRSPRTIVVSFDKEEKPFIYPEAFLGGFLKIDK